MFRTNDLRTGVLGIVERMKGDEPASVTLTQHKDSRTERNILLSCVLYDFAWNFGKQERTGEVRKKKKTTETKREQNCQSQEPQKQGEERGVNSCIAGPA